MAHNQSTRDDERLGEGLCPRYLGKEDSPARKNHKEIKEIKIHKENKVCLARLPPPAPSSCLKKSASPAHTSMSKRDIVPIGSDTYIRNGYHFIVRIKDAVRFRGEEEINTNLT